MRKTTLKEKEREGGREREKEGGKKGRRGGRKKGSKKGGKKGKKENIPQRGSILHYQDPNNYDLFMLQSTLSR